MLFGSYWNICGIILLITFIDVNSLSLNNEKCLNHCSNDGVCLVIKNKVQCYCLPEWEGERCDKATIEPTSYRLEKNEILRNNFRNVPCSYVPNLCQNGGVCFLDDGTGKLACKCPDRWDGARCTEPSVCNEYCFNNGLCEVQSGQPVCTDCGDKFDGVRCQSVKTTTTVDPPSTTTDIGCTFLPVGYCNKGTCAVNKNKVAYCQCPPTYTGDQCQTATGGGSKGPDPPGPIINPITNNTIGGGNGNACASNPCFYNSACYNTGNSYYCLCGANYQGANCQIVNG